MSMHLGPKRLVVGNADNATASLPRRLVVHETLSDPAVDDDGGIQDVFRAIVDDEERTGIICARHTVPCVSGLVQGADRAVRRTCPAGPR